MMETRRNITAAAAIAIVAISLWMSPAVWAQRSTERLEDALFAAGARTEAREVVEIVMIIRLSRELDLSEDETVILVRRMADFRDDLAQMHKEQGKLRKALQEAYFQNADDEALRSKLEKLREQDRRINNIRLDLHEKLSEGYDARVQTRLYLFLQNFEESMRRMVQRVRERSRGMSGGRGGRGGGFGGFGRSGRGNPPPQQLRDGGRRGRGDARPRPDRSNGGTDRPDADRPDGDPESDPN